MNIKCILCNEDIVEKHICKFKHCISSIKSSIIFIEKTMIGR